MKLIFQRIKGDLYLAREPDSLFKKVEPNRETPRLDPELLDHDCFLKSIKGDFHFVFDLKEPSKKSAARSR